MIIKMAKGTKYLENRPNTLKENKLMLCKLRNRNKIAHKCLPEIKKLIDKFNAKSALKLSKSAKTSLDTKQENIQTPSPYGPIDGFRPGSWWGIRMDCSRDRVHRPFDNDIDEGPFGAVSVCTSHANTNNDVDLGSYLTITSEDCISEVQTTNPLLQNYRNQLPLRLIRSYNLSNDYAPKTGYRYDGLYAVIACWIGVASETDKYYKFALARLRHQNLPAWQLSRQSSASRLKNSKIRQTRCAVKKFAANRHNDSQNSRSNNVESSKTTIPRTLTSSLKNFNVPNNESSILTRCISKKSEVPLRSSMVSVPYADTSPSSNNRLLDNTSSKSAFFKLQNTNISIRTDLYDSSNIVQQETRKTTPMTFCRTYKNSRLPGRTINHSNVVSLNLNSCGPCPRDNVQESLIQSRSGVAKFSPGQSPGSDPNCDRATPKNTTSVNAEFKTNLDEGRTNSPSVENSVSELTVEHSADVSQKNQLENTIDAEETTRTMPNSVKIVSDFADNEERENEKIRHSTDKEMSKTLSNAELDERVSNKFHADLDSLTPDQMLNFIVKQKYHPTAKLLIGSVIGLATGESTILRAYESLVSRKDHWCNEKDPRTDENELKSLQGNEEKIIHSRDDDFRKKPVNKDRSDDANASASLPNARLLRENKDRLMRKMKLRRTRVSKRLICSEKKLNTSNVRSSVSQRLRKTNLTEVKSQQPFSKSTALKKSKKTAKKRRGELANLVIDAKIGPIIRGPRNRRLRCRTHIFAKMRHGNKEIVPNCCAEKATHVQRQGKKGIVSAELSSRKSKVLADKRQMSKSRFRDVSTRLRRNERNCPVKASAKLHETQILHTQQDNCSRNRTSKGEKRKLSRTRCRSGEEVSNEPRKIIRSESRKNDEIRRVRMIDAATQCTASRRDVTTCIDLDIIEASRSENSLNSVKIEWIDVDDVKSEIYEDPFEESNHEDVSNYYEDRRVSTIQRDPEIRPQADKPPAIITSRLSAFVPVNISDGDSRIARLRSLGFKPIQPDRISGKEKQSSNDYDEDFTSTSTKSVFETTAVTSRDVDELFNKYTSEETAAVGYMDQDLCYQDIEDEEGNFLRKKKNVYGRAKRGGKVMKMSYKNITGTTDARRDSSNEEDSEVPWHGWKKFVKNKEAQWVGW